MQETRLVLLLVPADEVLVRFELHLLRIGSRCFAPRILMKGGKKAKICFVIHIAGFFLNFFFGYEVIVKQIFYKRPTNHYSHVMDTC